MSEQLSDIRSDNVRGEARNIVAKIFAGAMVFTTASEAAEIPKDTPWAKGYDLMLDDVRTKPYEVAGIVVNRDGKYTWQNWNTAKDAGISGITAPRQQTIEALQNPDLSDVCVIHAHNEIEPNQSRAPSAPPGFRDSVIVVRTTAELPQILSRKEKLDGLRWGVVDGLGFWSLQVKWLNGQQYRNRKEVLDEMVTNISRYVLANERAVQWKNNVSNMTAGSDTFQRLDDKAKVNYLKNSNDYKVLVEAFRNVNILLSYKSHDDAKKDIPCKP